MIPALLLAIAAANPAILATPDTLGAPRLEAFVTHERIKIDGRLDEPAWTQAAVADRFTQRDPDEGSPASERTEVRVLVGEGSLYVGARLHDRDARAIRRRLVRRDESLASDYFTVYLDSEHGRVTAYRFDVNPAGSYGESVVDARGAEDPSWDPVWHVHTSVDSAGWTAEMEIPLSQIRFRGTPGGTWGIQVERWIDRKQELDQFAFVPRKEHSDVSRYGVLGGLGELHGQRRLELLPYALGKFGNRLVAEDDPFHDPHETHGAIGGDLRYRPGTGLTLDATVHPDFGQVEVDPAVVNLTATETFFPEKRPFFVEGAELFQFGQTRSNNYFSTPLVFHARRIGRAPQFVVRDPAFGFVDSPEQTDILGAVKLTGKTGEHWSIGLLDAVTNEERARADSAGVVRRIPVEPLTNYGTARLRHESGQTTIGAIVTSVVRERGDDALDSILRSRAHVAGLDLNHYWDNRRWSFDANLIGSTVRGSAEAIALTQRSSVRYYQRPDAPHLTYDPTRTHLEGYADFASIQRIGGEHWQGSLTWQEMSPGFESNDLGYIGGVDVRGISSLLLYKQDKPTKTLRRWNVIAFTNDSFNRAGDLTYQGYETQGTFTFANYWGTDFRASWYPRAFDDRLTRGGPVAATPSGGRGWLTVATDSRRTWTLRTRVNSSWNDAGTRSLQVTPALSIRPTTSLSLSFEPSIQTSRDMAQYVATVPDPEATATYGARYVFATLEQHVVSLDTRVDWTFSPTLSLQLYLQPFIATGRFHSLKQLRAPRTSDYDVYGGGAGTIDRTPDGGYRIDPDGAGPASSFDVPNPDFNFRSLLGNAVLRWQYRPGSAIFLVWQQSRAGVAPFGDYEFSRDFRALFDQRPENTIALKATYWFKL
jgi:hypothetical protein